LIVGKLLFGGGRLVLKDVLMIADSARQLLRAGKTTQ
jgi:uncharacterized membrane protein YkgB